MTDTATRRPARLTFAAGVIDVTPADRSAFLLAAARAADASRTPVDPDRRLDRFESDLLFPVHDWCMAHVGHVRACYVAPAGGRVAVYVVTVSPRFDFRLAGDLAALELTLARAGWRVGVTQVPAVDDPEALAGLLRPAEAVEVYADSGPAPGKG